MSLIIKGLDLPPKGELIRVDIYHDEVIATNVDGWNGEVDIPNITAIPIPTPHGRLIDARQLEIDIIYAVIDRLRNDAPTILEAEPNND